MNTFTSVIAIAVTTLSVVSSSQATIQPLEPIPEPTMQPMKVITLNDRLSNADIDTRRKLVYEKVSDVAKVHGVNPDVVYGTIAKCENKALEPKLQSGHLYKFSDQRRGIVAGTQEKSFGLAMIHLPDHPTVSYEQATDSEFAIEWMVKEFAQGRQNQWTCYKILYGQSK